MKIDFFEKEVWKVQQRFNHFFGAQTICNIQERQAVIMAICWLSVLSKRIKGTAENTEIVREFIKYRNKLNKYFNQKKRSENYVEFTNKGANGEDAQVIRNRACSIKR